MDELGQELREALAVNFQGAEGPSDRDVDEAVDFLACLIDGTIPFVSARSQRR